jgi:hypothetical protein
VFWLTSVFSYILQNGGGQANGPVGNQGAALLVPNIEDTRAMLKGMNLDKNVPVGNSDAASYFNNEVLAAIDYGVSFLPPDAFPSDCQDRWRMSIHGLEMSL